MVVDHRILQVAEVDIVWKSKIPASERPKVTGSGDAVEIMRLLFREDMIEHHEEFKVMILNRSNKVLAVKSISSGGITGTVTDIRIIMQTALILSEQHKRISKKVIKDIIKANGTSLILFHNHPSGNLQPSEADIAITKRLKEASFICDITLLDHIIITSESYFSFADENLI